MKTILIAGMVVAWMCLTGCQTLGIGGGGTNTNTTAAVSK